MHIYLQLHEEEKFHGKTEHKMESKEGGRRLLMGLTNDTGTKKGRERLLRLVQSLALFVMRKAH